MKKINKYALTGVFENGLKFKARSKFEQLIEDQLREEGKVPVIDRDTEWLIDWDEESDKYHFEIFMYGVYVGRVKAQQICGWGEEKSEAIYF